YFAPEKFKQPETTDHKECGIGDHIPEIWYAEQHSVISKIMVVGILRNCRKAEYGEYCNHTNQPD
ncbi:MAG: hypothetical protein KA365_06875, partial [Arenimonas sp.]|nr:hypothetical protein [Arenimonas sp.]